MDVTKLKYSQRDRFWHLFGTLFTGCLTDVNEEIEISCCLACTKIMVPYLKRTYFRDHIIIERTDYKVYKWPLIDWVHGEGYGGNVGYHHSLFLWTASLAIIPMKHIMDCPFYILDIKPAQKPKQKPKNKTNRKKPVSLLVYFKELVSSLKAFEYIRWLNIKWDKCLNLYWPEQNWVWYSNTAFIRKIFCNTVGKHCWSSTNVIILL